MLKIYTHTIHRALKLIMQFFNTKGKAVKAILTEWRVMLCVIIEYMNVLFFYVPEWSVSSYNTKCKTCAKP